MYYESELYHYGVPGMKWGVRNASYAVKNTGRAIDRAKTNVRVANGVRTLGDPSVVGKQLYIQSKKRKRR